MNIKKECQKRKVSWVVAIIIVIFTITKNDFFAAEAAQTQFQIVDLHEYQMKLEAKKQTVRISPEFVKSGGFWKPGERLEFKMEELISNMRKMLRDVKDVDWKQGEVAIHSFGISGKEWYMVIVFWTEAGDVIPMFSNMKGVTWPIGKKYDEFEKMKPSTD